MYTINTLEGSYTIGAAPLEQGKDYIHAPAEHKNHLSIAVNALGGMISTVIGTTPDAKLDDVAAMLAPAIAANAATLMGTDTPEHGDKRKATLYFEHNGGAAGVEGMEFTFTKKTH